MKKNFSKKTFYIASILIIFMQNFTFAMEQTPEDVVKKYYTVDLNGAKLSMDTYEAIISPLIAWENEQGWDIAFVARKAYINNVEKINDNEVHIKVCYENAGVLSGDEVIEDEFVEEIELVLGRSVIDESVLYPNDALIKKLYSGKIIRYKNPESKDYPCYIFFDETINTDLQLKERLVQTGISANEIEMVLTLWRKTMMEKKQWEIIRPIFPPHVSPEALITHFKALLRNTQKESARIEKLTKTIKILEDLIH